MPKLTETVMALAADVALLWIEVDSRHRETNIYT
jgi:hypothetical protein